MPVPADAPAPPRPDAWVALRRWTPARLALGRAGASMPTAEVLRFAADHALARDAVHVPLDTAALQAGLRHDGWHGVAVVASRAPDRDTYLRRPDLGRRLSADAARRLREVAAASGAAAETDGAGATDGGVSRGDDRASGVAEGADPAGGAGGRVDLALVLGDGLSAVAVQRHARPLLAALREALARGAGPPLRWAPPVVATQARVALADEVGEILGASLVLILLGERPGLSAPDSLGAYLTHAPRVGCRDAQRNCVSNIRPDGLTAPAAAARLAWLILEARRRRVTGVGLKDDSPALVAAGATLR